jgi:wyosine [tRNA(Phe)-imidazoG37] synthetase (radical SAM superfamily)
VKNYKYLFGPVPSRRLGRSLGIDLTPCKTCNFDCVFCQLGRTRNKTAVRKEYVPVDEVLAEIESWLRDDGEADYITLSGSGEPTLHAGFGRVLDFLKKTDIPSALLTNGSMLNIPQVRDAALLADTVKISLSVWDQHSLEMINRPHEGFRFDDILEGQKNFRRHFKGLLLLEVFVLLGMNSMSADMEKIATHAKEIKPDRIQLNTVTRPPAEEFAAAPSAEILESLAGLFDPPAEIVAEFKSDLSGKIRANEETIMAMLRRRPCTMEQVAQAFDLHVNEASKYLGRLMRVGRIRAVRKKEAVYYDVSAERKNTESGTAM